MADVEQVLIRMLGGWAAASLAAGALLAQRAPGFARQTAAWGAVDGAIAVVGARRRSAKGPTDPRRLRSVLLLNAGLDAGYLLAGAWFVRDGRWREDGAAVLVQGAFLLALDATAARALPRR